MWIVQKLKELGNQQPSSEQEKVQRLSRKLGVGYVYPKHDLPKIIFIKYNHGKDIVYSL